MNDYDDYDAQAGDSLTDVGFFIAVLAAFFTFCGVMLWLVPPIAQFFAGKF